MKDFDMSPRRRLAPGAVRDSGRDDRAVGCSSSGAAAWAETVDDPTQAGCGVFRDLSQRKVVACDRQQLERIDGGDDRAIAMLVDDDVAGQEQAKVVVGVKAAPGEIGVAGAKDDV